MNTQAPAQDVIAELEYLEFSGRVTELRQAGRLSERAEQELRNMAEESADLREFKARMGYAGLHLINPTEYRYLTSTLETPEGQRPESWRQSKVYVRAFGIGRHSDGTELQQERERQAHALHHSC